MRQKEQGLQRRLLRVGSFIILYLGKLFNEEWFNLLHQKVVVSRVAQSVVPFFWMEAGDMVVRYRNEVYLKKKHPFFGLCKLLPEKYLISFGWLDSTGHGCFSGQLDHSCVNNWFILSYWKCFDISTMISHWKKVMRIVEALEAKGYRLPLMKGEVELVEKLAAITRQVGIFFFKLKLLSLWFLYLD